MPPWRSSPRLSPRNESWLPRSKSKFTMVNLICGIAISMAAIVTRTATSTNPLRSRITFQTLTRPAGWYPPSFVGGKFRRSVSAYQYVSWQLACCIARMVSSIYSFSITKNGFDSSILIEASID